MNDRMPSSYVWDEPIAWTTALLAYASLRLSEVQQLARTSKDPAIRDLIANVQSRPRPPTRLHHKERPNCSRGNRPQARWGRGVSRCHRGPRTAQTDVRSSSAIGHRTWPTPR
jgi:hypothetical protein